MAADHHDIREPVAPVSHFDDDEEDRFFNSRMHDLEHPNYVDDKLSRTVGVMVGGTFDATKDAFSKNNIAATGIETAASVAVGFAVRAAEAKVPELRPAVAIMGLAMTSSFVRDLADRGAALGGILADTWQHDDNVDKNRQAFAAIGGKFAVDLTLTSAAGLAGSHLGNRLLFGAGSNYTRIATYDGVGLLDKHAKPHDRLFSKDDPTALLYNKVRESTLSMHSRGTFTNKNYRSSAFLISEDGLAITNCHCAADHENFSFVDHTGAVHTGTVLAMDAPRDVAVMQLHPASEGTVFKPLKLAESDALPGDKLHVVSDQAGSTGLTLSPGTLHDIKSINFAPEMHTPANPAKIVAGVSVDAFTRQVRYYPGSDLRRTVPAERMLSSYFSKNGMSGSPLLSESGEVVGVHTGNFAAKLGSPLGPDKKFFSNDFAKLTGRTAASPVSAIEDVLMEALEKRSAGI